MRKLNLGSGRDIKEGWVNLDSVKLPGVDVVHDVEKLPLPFQDEEFDEILCRDILEHIEYIPVLKELHRILRPGGKIIIQVPHFTSKNNFLDPTHKKRFSIYTFDMLVENTSLFKKRDYYFDFHFSKIASVRITFDHSSRWFFYNRWVEPLVNLNATTKFIYESTGLCYDFPAQNIIIELIK